MTNTTCPYCGVGCGVRVSQGRVAGDATHPANLGRLCSKGAALGETLNDSGRLLYPTIAGERASWATAMDRIATRFAETIAAHGPNSVALYVSGQCLTEDYYVANKLMKGFIGTANIDTNSRLCMASSVAGHTRAFGADVVPGIYEDLEEADLVVLVGSNLAWCHPVLYRRLVAARAARGTRIVVIDPRRTATCDEADLHLPLAPGSDVTLFNALLRHLHATGSINAAWLTAHATGLEAALAAAAGEDPAAITQLPPADIATFLDWFATTPRVVTVYSQGVNQSSAGTDKVNAILNCHLATGRIGQPGTGPFSITGQPNAMGGREVGGLANQLAAHMRFDDQAAIDRVRRFWNAPRIATKPGLKAVELFDSVRDGRVKALWIIATNPADSLPRSARVREALRACPFVVVSDCWPTDTTALAEIVLPAAGWGEKDGTVTNSERMISRQRAFRPAPGEARPDWQALADLAARLGHGPAFAWPNAAAIFREHAALSAFENHGTRTFDLSGLATLSDAAYETFAPTRWPVRDRPATRLFANGNFPTPDGRARLIPTPWRPPARRPDATFPLLLNTGRTRDQWHTMTRTGLVPRLMTHADAPTLTLAPADAANLAIQTGDLVRLTSPHGAQLLQAAISADQRRGEAFLPMHWTDVFSAAGPVGRTVGAAVDPVSGQPEMKATPIRVARVPTLWRGLLLRRDAISPDEPGLWWSRTPLDGGHALTLAGTTTLPHDLGALAARLLGPTGSERIELADPARGSWRFALLRDGRLEACLFITTGNTHLPTAASLAPLLTSTVPDAARAGLLAGRTTTGPAPGKSICACFSVSLQTIRTAITDHRLTTIAEIGSLLSAGTNCGSCIPELREILRDAHAEAL